MQSYSPPVIIQVIRDRSPVVYDNYSAKGALVLGILQIILGLIAFVFNIVAIVYFVALSLGGHGIWMAPMWCIAGAFGILSSKKKSKCTIITTLVMSIISASFLAIYLPMTSMQIAFNDLGNYDYDYDYEYRCGCSDYYNPETGSTETTCYDCAYDKDSSDDPIKYSASSLMLLAGVLEFIASIAASALACRAVCCRRKNPARSEVDITTSSGRQSVQIPAGYQVIQTGSPVHSVDTKNTMQPSQYDGGSPPPPYSYGY